jgi:hypothetical protein
MDTAALVEDQIEDGRKLIEQLVCDGFDVTVAFWVRFQFEEDGPWFYIVSETVDRDGLHAAYRAVHESIQRIRAPWGPWISVSDVGELKLVGMNDPLAKQVLAFRDRYPSKYRFRGANIGNQFVEELYIYPPVTKPAARGERCGKLTINIGTDAEPELVDLERVPLVTIIRDSAGPSKVVLVGGGKPQRALEGEEAQRFIAQFDAIREQMK